MSDEVSDFLRSVERLKERREEEDEARSRELEEKILQEKRERQARRAGTTNPLSFYPSKPVSWNRCTRAFLQRAQKLETGNTNHCISYASTEPGTRAFAGRLFAGMRSANNITCRAREINLTTKIVSRKHTAADCQPCRHSAVGLQRHKFTITWPRGPREPPATRR